MEQQFPRDAFVEDERRRRSPEWDFGVHWRHSDDGPDWPRYRVSWIVETGELYAIPNWPTGHVTVLAVIEKVGDYPYPTDGADGYRYSSGQAWADFNKAQTIEQLLEGWAEEPRTLDWIRERLQQVTA